MCLRASSSNTVYPSYAQHTFPLKTRLKALLEMSVNLYHDFYTSELKFIMMQYFKDVTRPDLYCYALVFKDISRRYALCSSFYFSFPRVLSSCLCNFCLNPLFWLPTDLEVLCTFLGTRALVSLMFPCIYFPPTTSAFGVTQGRSSLRVCSVPQLYSTLWQPCGLQPARVLSPWIFQARILDWVVISSSRGSSQPRDQTRIFCISCFGRWILY